MSTPYDDIDGADLSKKSVTSGSFGDDCIKRLSCHSSSRKHQSEVNSTFLRALLVVSLVCGAVLCSTLSYYWLVYSEHVLFSTHFESICDGAISNVENAFERMNNGLLELSNVYSNQFPNASSWPYVVLPGYYRTADLLGKAAGFDNIGFSPIVRPDQIQEFKNFSADYFASEPNTKGIVAFGGFPVGTIWKLLPNLKPARDKTGETKFSNRTLLVPPIQLTSSSNIGSVYLGFNLHSSSTFGPVIDEILDCVYQSNLSVAINSCGGISETVSVPFATYVEPHPVIQDIQAMLIQPILPANNQSVVVGFLEGGLSWKNLLLHSVPTFVSGVDCVIQTEKDVATYSIKRGDPIFQGFGDHHDKKYTKYGRSSGTLTKTFGASNSVRYVLSFYPRSELVQSYSNNNPYYAIAVLLGSFLFCCFVFVAYDLSMMRKFDRNRAVSEMKRRFVRFISHEIRTPLNTVRLGMKLLESELSSVSKLVATSPATELPKVINGAIRSWRHLAGEISENSGNAVEVLDDLLNYDQIEAKTLQLDLSPFNIWKLIAKVVAMAQSQAQQKNVILKYIGENAEKSLQEAAKVGIHSAFSVRPAGPISNVEEVNVVIGDSTKMHQVIRNLIVNALKFTPSGGVVTVSVRTIGDDPTKAEDDENGVFRQSYKTKSLSNQALSIGPFSSVPRAGSVLIIIKDSGPGLSEEQIEHFEQLSKGGVSENRNEEQTAQGNGLALFICKGIIEQHGGHISVQSEGPGKGTTIEVQLPLYRKLAAHLLHQQHSNTTAEWASNSIELSTRTGADNRIVEKFHRLLVVDDSVPNRKMLCRLLETKGYVCIQAEDGAEAIRKYSDDQAQGMEVNAILLDYEMPVMNGPTAAKKLREMGFDRLIIGITGNVLTEDVTLFKECGVDEVLPKPLVLSEFEDVLRRNVNVGDGQRVDRNGNVFGASKMSTKPSIKSTIVEQNIARVHPFENV